ncbi:choline/ethanolamine kinase-like isoform X2 [Ischnura elegans]|uniref:choline/ethanolamine kinase-like isoform X2 n=1 Tax=Ischnura elegans TaxID=197161 RepID=UPI001ED866D8|nr:choline/ethanolamine kinase-like isoform X2 [Ischnura elegans]
MGIKDKMNPDSLEMRERAFRICRDYLHGAWRNISSQDMVLKRISGGLSNWLFYCALPVTHPPRQGEPARVLLRLYGQIHGGNNVGGGGGGPGAANVPVPTQSPLEGILTESVIFTLLSERRLGPRLHGVFPGGRLEEYIPAQPLKTAQMSDPKLIPLIAEKMALIHSMNVPISKEPRWLWDTMQRWMLNVQEIKADYELKNLACDDKGALIEDVLRHNFADEVDWLKKQVKKLSSPVVFCHNDMQEGNILLREEETAETKAANQLSPSRHHSNMVIIDFEYCSYNYRGFDIANHFCEWTYDYTLDSHPNFSSCPKAYPSRDQQLMFIRSYLQTVRKSKRYQQSSSGVDIEKEAEQVMAEVQVFTMASHLFWGLWSLVNAKISQIPFGYWEYAAARLDGYFKRKSQIIGQSVDSTLKRKADDMEH